MKNHILIMMKFPRVGEVNTRMIPDIGAEQATLVHQKMAEDTIAKVNDFGNAKAIVHITNCTDEEASQWMGAVEYYFQEGDDLGERMANAVERSIGLGADKILVVGTDCPSLVVEVFEEALNLLDSNDVVYTPAHDGGYVLIGMKHLYKAAFHNIQWGTEKVLDQSLKNLRASELSFHLLDSMQDIDYAQDIPRHFLI